MRGSASCAVTTSQNAFSVAASSAVKKRTQRHVLDPVEDDAPGHLVPVTALREHIVVGVPTDQLWRHSLPLRRQTAGVGPCSLASHRSRLTIAAAIPSAPTRQSEPGASNGGPITRL